MLPQTVLPFKLAPTDEQLTAHGGLVLFGEVLQAMNAPRQLNAALPAPGSRIGYHPAQFVESLLPMLHGGGRTLAGLARFVRTRACGRCCESPWFPVPMPRAIGSDAWGSRMG